MREAIRRGDRWAAEFDIEGFFTNLRHPRLLREVAKVVDDVEVIGLIRRWLKAGVLTDDGYEPSTAGTPQGGVISPLLANIYLHRLDVEVRPAGSRLIRYADDFVIMTRTRVEAQAADRLVRHILADIGLSWPRPKPASAESATDSSSWGSSSKGGPFNPDPPRSNGSRTGSGPSPGAKPPCPWPE